MSNSQPEPGPSIPVPSFDLRHRLARALEHAGVKVGEMAAYLEVSESTMTNYLSGRTRPRAGSLRAWALRTGVPFEWLEKGTVSGPEGGSGQHGDASARSGAKDDLCPVFTMQPAGHLLAHTG